VAWLVGSPASGTSVSEPTTVDDVSTGSSLRKLS